MKTIKIRDYVNWAKVVWSWETWKKIREDIDKYDKAILDFEWIETTCTAVFNNMLYDFDKIKDKVKFKNCNDYIKKIIIEVINL